MELCKQTLEDYIEELNSEYPDLRDRAGFGERLNIAYQILEALRTIHQEHKLIHRDLSLRNIFIGNDSVVKIGDFGLATKCQHLVPLRPSPAGISPAPSADDPGSFRLDSEENAAEEEEVLTHGLGTQTFSSPEQMSDLPYDQRVSQMRYYFRGSRTYTRSD